VREAFEAGRKAYRRIQKQKRPAQALLDDKRIQRELRDAAEALRDASDRLRGRSRRKRSWGVKLLVVGLLGAIAAVVLSDDLRKALLDRLFGAEEEFEYTSATGAPTNGAPVAN
jgi:hypothetical protein